MSCQDYTAAIGDYVDGTLQAHSRLALEAHATTCASCQALLADLEVIRQTALALEPHLPPARVWGKLADAVETAPGGRLRAWWWGWQSVAATAMTLTVVVSLSWIGGRLVAVNAESERLASGARLALDSEFDLVAAHYARTITGLESIAETESSALDEDTASVMQASLTLIDGAIVESRTALDTQPDSHVAQQSLFEALRSKVELLQDIIALINEMRKGDPEGAARIASGLNP
jgi:hypothetical protein